METCRDEIIRYFAGIDVRESALIEHLPQETVSVKRGDFPVMATDENGEKLLLVFEMQTRWDHDVPLNLMDYRTRYMLKYRVKTVSFIILLTPSGSATGVYRDNEVRFAFNLIRIYIMDGREVVRGPLCLAPFVPLMKHGADLLDQADDLICRSRKTRTQKADLLTSMAILSGIVSKELLVRLINTR